MSLIEVKNVSKRYKTGDTETVALDNVSLSINKGEFVSIIGPSGSGKSTLMHILGLLDSPSSGEYWIDNQRMDNQKDKNLAKLRRKSIGFVFQSFNLLPRLNVLQNVMLPMAYAGVPTRKRKALAVNLLERVGLGERVGHRLNQISGGQTQRVAVARALANDPHLILADEPTGNLDTKSSGNIIQLLRELHQEGNTIIIVTHNPEIAENTQRVIEIRDGKVVNDRAGLAVTASAKKPKQNRKVAL